ncbi:zinc finger BED domain-containing protein 4-like [Festucalex cinctus]
MTASLLEQKTAISVYAADHQLPATLTANNWTLLEKVNTLLAPFEEITKQTTFTTSTISEVIPSVTVLKRLLAKEPPEDSGIKTMSATLLAAVDTRFQIEAEPLYAVATLLDPRYKDRYLTSAENNKFSKSALAQEVEKNEESRRPTQTTSTTTEVAGPASKTPRMEEPNTGSSKSCFAELYEEVLQEYDVEQGGASSTITQVQIETYLAEKTIHRMESPFEYWGKNKERLLSLAMTAAKFLCAPSTSVDSERLFSAASNILDVKKNRLLGEKVETLIFLKKNLPMYLNLKLKDSNPQED